MIDEKKDKWAFILNPVAGNGSGERLLPELERKIKEFDINGEILITGHPGHAIRLSVSAAEKGINNIVAVGGDGTMNEISRHLINKKDICVGIIPAGTGNDFSQITGFPDKFEGKDWELFFRKNVIAMDVGVVNDTIFLNGMGIGFDAEVAAQNYTDDGKVKKGGSHKYIWHILKTLVYFKEKRMTVVTDSEQHETDCFINTVSIGRRFAGGFFLTPKAVANDGLLDVCSIQRLNLFHRFRLLLKVPKGTHIEDKKVKYYRTSILKLDFPQNVPYHVDGEILFANRFNIRIIPKGLNLIYNPDGAHYFAR